MEPKKEAFVKVGQTLVDQASLLSNNILTQRFNRHPQISGFPHDRKQSFAYIQEFIKLLGSTLTLEGDQAEVVLMNWAEQTALYAVDYGQSLDVAMQPLPFIRKEILILIEELAETETFSVLDVMSVIKNIDINLDFASHMFSQTYVKNHQMILNEKTKALHELSGPIVPLFDGIGVLPLIGEIDHERAQILQITTLERCVENKIFSLVIDLSGVHTLTPEVLRSIFLLIDSLRLLGVRVIVTGIRPEIALTASFFEIDMREVQTNGNLKQALSALGYGKLIDNKNRPLVLR
jgi:rsbT co-antagonist protein RsbR